jgi:hypothetical protein
MLVVWGRASTTSAALGEVRGAIGRSIGRGASHVTTHNRHPRCRGWGRGRHVQPGHKTSYWPGTIDGAVHPVKPGESGAGRQAPTVADRRATIVAAATV